MRRNMPCANHTDEQQDTDNDKSHSNVQQNMSCANHTDEQQDTDNDKSHIGMSELCSRVIENEVDKRRIEQVHAHQTQQQRSRQN